MVSLRPGHDLPNPVPPLAHAQHHRVIQLVVRVRVRPLHAGPLTIRTVRWIVIGIILIRTGPIADDDPSLRVQALPVFHGSDLHLPPQTTYLTNSSFLIGILNTALSSMLIRLGFRDRSN